MYHSVGIVNNDWQWSYLTCPFQVFESQLRLLKKCNYNTLTLKELYRYVIFGEEVPKNSVVITFDDGYLDNWIYAFPLLKKYQMCGTVFVNPEFVVKDCVVRKRFDQVDNVYTLESNGFLSWEELRIMENEKVIFTESHALTHTWYPINNTIVDFRHPGDDYIWMTWNGNVDKKPFLQIDNPDFVRFGEPVFQHDKSLSSPKYFPDMKLSNYLVKIVEENGRERFFSQKNWKAKLLKEVDNYKSKNALNERYESVSEYKDRIKHELSFTKEKIERELNKELFFLCWPGGSATRMGLEVAHEVGYTFFNTARDLTVPERKRVRNSKNSKSNRVSRFAPVLYFNNEEGRGSVIRYSKGLYFYAQLRAHEIGNMSQVLYQIANRLIKIILDLRFYKVKS